MKHIFVLVAALLLSSSLATGQTTSPDQTPGITQEATPVTTQEATPDNTTGINQDQATGTTQEATPVTTQEATLAIGTTNQEQAPGFTLATGTTNQDPATHPGTTKEAPTPERTSTPEQATTPALEHATTQEHTPATPTPEPASFENLHLLQRAGSPVQTHIMVDISRAGENSFSYALLSDDISPSGNFAYIQLFHEHKFWQAPLFLHAEYRSYGLDSHCLYLGAAYDFFTPHGMIAVEPLLRNDSLFAGNSLPVLRADSFSAQLSIITGHDWGWCNLNSFTDIWSAARSGSSAGLYSEAWLYFPLNSRLQLGGISCLSWDFASKPQLTVFLGIKFNM